jgi:beta-ureidopropionase / N-carbamoyl-L-amino-acid hydrolase
VTDQQFLADFHALSAIGATQAGGVERQAATEAHRQVREWLGAWLRDRGFTTTVDRIGNLFGLREWRPGAPYVLVGSHLDSQPRGGRYDGAYGVLAAAHAAERVHRRCTGSGELPAFNVAVVDWFNEEGSRFKPSMMGSAVYTGKMPLEAAWAVTDQDGVTVRQALAATGFLGEQDGPRPAFAAEIHIEQGRILDKEGVRIGLVESNWAAHKYQISVVGAQSHTGSTIMADRQDALLGAARVVVAVRELTEQFPDIPLHTSAGQLFVHPNSPVVVARQADLHLDLRSESLAVLQEADRLLDQEFAAIEASTNVEIIKRSAHFWPVTPYQPEGVELARQAATDLGLSHRRMLTLAGHDSTNLKDVVPTVMLFVPSVEGISHNEHEFTRDEDICVGVDLLTEVVERLCRGAVTTIDQDKD